MKRIFLVLTAIGMMLGLGVCAASADDFTKTFTIASPRHIEHMLYARQNPPFMILAPAGWYMATRRPDAAAGVIGAYFFKEDPTEEGKKGNLVTPYIRVDFFRNKDIPSAIVYARQVVKTLKDEGVKILVGAEEIEIDGRAMGHFTTKGTPAGGDDVIDNYVFVNSTHVIMVTGVCKPDQFDAVKKKFREAVDSIEFKAPDTIT